MSRPTIEGFERARALVRQAMVTRGMDNRALADAAGIDEGTVGEFLRIPDRWLALRTQGKIERALGLEPGILDRTARENPDRTTRSHLSEVPATVPVHVVEDGVGGASGRNIVRVHIGALDVEMEATYIDAEDRERALAMLLRAAGIDGGHVASADRGELGG